MKKIQVAQPYFGDEEKRAVADALDRGEISGFFGSYLPKFEDAFAGYSDCAHGVAVSNGTVALHLALAALRIGPGDEVLVSTFTNMATFFAVLYQGATPIPIDSEPETWNMDPALLEAKVTAKTKAIIVVHIYGHPADMDPILAVAKKHGLAVVEDCAEAHGATYKGKKVGSLGDIGCFSFYANKIITTGEGGMLTTNKKELADRSRMLKSLAFGTENKFMHQDVGYNYRMTNYQAAFGYAQTAKIERIIAMKRELGAFYNDAFSGVPEIQTPIEKPFARNVYWMYTLILRGAARGNRRAVMDSLTKAGIESRETFIPFNGQELFISKGLTKLEDCPVANGLGANGFYIPSGPVLSDDDRRYVADAVRRAVADASR
jgi:perosamine synthetase